MAEMLKLTLTAHEVTAVSLQSASVKLVADTFVKVVLGTFVRIM